MSSHQQLMITGNVGNDPQLRYMQDGTAVTSLNIAVNKKWTDTEGNKKEKTTWFSISVWRKQAEVVVQYVKKGSKVQVIANDVEARTWTDGNGETHAGIQAQAREVIFLDTRTGESTTDDNEIPV